MLLLKDEMETISKKSSVRNVFIDTLDVQLPLNTAFIRVSQKIAIEMQNDIISDNADSFMKKYNMKIFPEYRRTLLTHMFLAARYNSTKVLKKKCLEFLHFV